MNIPLTIKETQKGLLEKEFSVVELVDEYLKRIDKNKDLNAYITVTADKAHKDAKKIEKLIEENGKGAFESKPLLGITVSHKDLFLTKGIRTTAGAKVLNSYIPEYSSTVVNKIENAGAILLGKLNCDAWAHGASGENSDFGPAENPWKKGRVPGGSSSGSAASVAAGLTLFSTGTDTGGSIRLPSSFCGVVGFKPTYGAVSRYGVIAMASSLDSVGHMARTVEDVETIFNVTKGTDSHDSTLKNEKEALKKGRKLRIGIPKEYFADGLGEDVKESVLKASKIFEKDNFELVDISLPHTKYAISVYYIVQPAEVSSNLSRYDGVRYGNDRSSFSAEAKRRIMLGSYVLSAGYYDAFYLKAQKVRSKIIEDFEKAFDKVDAILAPVSPTAAFRMGEKASDPLQMYLADILTVAANLAGLPALAIPSGFNKEGLPLGFQLIGPRFSESLLFNIGKKYEKLTNYRPQVAK